MRESNATSHDSHYNKADHRFGMESIAIMEAIACTGIPEEFWTLCKRNLNLALGFKYEARLGEKDDPNKEMDKAANFRYRARHGFWPWNAVKEFHGVKDHEPISKKVCETGKILGSEGSCTLPKIQFEPEGIIPLSERAKYTKWAVDTLLKSISSDIPVFVPPPAHFKDLVSKQKAERDAFFKGAQWTEEQLRVSEGTRRAIDLITKNTGEPLPYDSAIKAQYISTEELQKELQRAEMNIALNEGNAEAVKSWEAAKRLIVGNLLQRGEKVSSPQGYPVP